MAEYLPLIVSHVRQLVKAAHAVPHSRGVNTMWPSVVDTWTGLQPPGEHVPQRVYRLIGAPRGSTPYWDQPLIVAAHLAAEVAGTEDLREAADAYLHAFLAECVGDNGLFLWGNHQYFNLYTRQIVHFHGGHHELRPITPAWELFWRHDPQRTAEYIRVMTCRHMYDPATGAFNRHDTNTRDYAFIEAGGILVESLAWLYGKTGEAELLDRAERIARYSYSHRDASTGLLINEPDKGRWDAKVSTTEVGVWAQSLLRAAAYADHPLFSQMARQVVRAWITRGFEAETSQPFGQLDVRTGEPVTPQSKGYWPGRYANPWNVDQWPHHDYPMSLAEACVTLFIQTGDEAFDERFFLESSRPLDGRRALGRKLRRSIDEAFRRFGADGLQLRPGELVVEADLAACPPARWRELIRHLDQAAALVEVKPLRIRGLGEEREVARGADGAARCVFCRDGISGDEDDLVACERCRTALHAECWEEHGGCPVLGCDGRAPERARARA
ncbi:MAG: hypothetical protein KIT58_12640 [Planctomycetota bacterium]|nr:hypothetical protein [Planctomycetota bacterium]